MPKADPETLAITSLALCYAGVREGSAWQERWVGGWVKDSAQTMEMLLWKVDTAGYKGKNGLEILGVGQKYEISLKITE